MRENCPGIDVLRLMLSDVEEEADAIRPYDPGRASHLDEAANEMRAVIAEDEVTSDGHFSAA